MISDTGASEQPLTAPCQKVMPRNQKAREQSKVKESWEAVSAYGGHAILEVHTKFLINQRRDLESAYGAYVFS